MSNIDIKRIDSKKYQTYRVLRAPGPWSEAYRKRVKELSPYRGAVIFPESIIGANSYMYSVRSTNMTTSMGRNNVGFNITRNTTRLLFDGEEVFDVEELMNLEHDNPDSVYQLKWPIDGALVPFFETTVFRTADNAAQYVKKNIDAEIKKHFG